MKNLVNYAKYYARNGFYVLPMVDKKPLITFADKPALTESDIEKIWLLKPYAQIAVRTVDFFVVDIDRHEGGADGFKSIRELKHFNWFPKTLMQTTAHGGQQLFYRKPQGTEVSQHIGWLPGVDIKAHINNYVMIAPSTVGSGQYKWANKLPMAEPPSALIEDINRDVPAEAAYQGPAAFKGHKSNTAELFEQIVKGLGETGGRNNALATFVGALLIRNVDPQVAYELAKQANANTPKTLDEKEFEKTFDSIIKTELHRREMMKLGQQESNAATGGGAE